MTDRGNPRTISSALPDYLTHRRVPPIPLSSLRSHPLRSIRSADPISGSLDSPGFVAAKIFNSALGIILFGTAAAFGVARFGFGLDNENLITMHRFTGQFGGLISLILSTCQLMVGPNTGHKWRLWHTSIAGPAITLAFFMPSTRATLFLIWLLGSVFLCATRTP